MPRDSATQSGVLGEEPLVEMFRHRVSEPSLLGVIDPRVKIAAKRNRDARVASYRYR